MDNKTLAAYILQALTLAQREGRSENLETLVETLRVRRKDIRTTLTVLHRQGLVDVLRMRLSLTGFAIGTALVGQSLPELRKTALAAIVAA
jgi:hypothetical protein